MNNSDKIIVDLESIMNKKYEYFKKCCIEYIEKFGLKDFEFDIILDSDNGNLYGMSDVNLKGRLATIGINKAWIKDSKSTYVEIKKTAFHEIMECMLCSIRTMLEVEYAYDKVDEEIHKIIRILENQEFGI